MATTSHQLDHEARAELLCYLVIAQLIARARTDDWLRTDHLVETTRIWLSANGSGLRLEGKVEVSWNMRRPGVGVLDAGAF